MRAPLRIAQRPRAQALQPITSLRSGETSACPVCGKSALLTCSRCKKQAYCSKECQRSDWKQHKKTCKAPEAATDADIIDVDLRIDPDTGLHGFCMDTESATSAMSRCRRTERTGMAGSHLLEDKVYVVKVQTPPHEGPLLCYDATRQFQLHITDKTCAEKRRLTELIRAKGVSGKVAMGGSRKAYFNAYRTGSTMKLLIHELLPLQAW